MAKSFMWQKSPDLFLYAKFLLGHKMFLSKWDILNFSVLRKQTTYMSTFIYDRTICFLQNILNPKGKKIVMISSHTNLIFLIIYTVDFWMF